MVSIVLKLFARQSTGTDGWTKRWLVASPSGGIYNIADRMSIFILQAWDIHRSFFIIFFVFILWTCYHPLPIEHRRQRIDVLAKGEELPM